nr:l-carnitine dehydrogenase [Quercus suber]
MSDSVKATGMAGEATKIGIVGSGTIGLSFAALHLMKNPSCTISIYDTRPDLQSYVKEHLPKYLVDYDQTDAFLRLSFASQLYDAVHDASIVQEQGPENADFKIGIWAEIEKLAPRNALLWSSTSGIPASVQSRDMQDKSRLIVVHPFNPPHIMPLVEVVPSPQTAADVVERTLEFWRALGRTPVLVKKECTGFVANRLSFALFREACSLVAQDVVSVEDLDAIVTASMGPRWTVAGPFKAYHAGGGEGGLTSFMEKIGGSVQNCWDASEKDLRNEKIVVGGDWQKEVCRQANESYGVINTAERDAKTKKVLAAVG